MAMAQSVLTNINGFVAALYYVIAGLGWVVPAMPLIAWMSRPENAPDEARLRVTSLAGPRRHHTADARVEGTGRSSTSSSRASLDDREQDTPRRRDVLAGRAPTRCGSPLPRSAPICCFSARPFGVRKMKTFLRRVPT